MSIKSLHSSAISQSIVWFNEVDFTNVYSIVPSILIVSLADNGVPVSAVADLYCGLLNAIAAIVYFFVPSIIPFSISNAKPCNNSLGNLLNAASNGLVKK